MGTLYVASLMAGGPGDITFRTRRVLGQVSLLATADPRQTQGWLDRYELNSAAAPLHPIDAVTSALHSGDVALLLDGWLSCPSASETAVIRAAIEGGYRVAPLPGPSLPIAVLVASGLPADSFVYLGELPSRPAERGELLALVSGERRTLLIAESCWRLPDILAELGGTLGERSLALVAVGEQGLGGIWRGTLQDALELDAELPQRGRCILVVAGRRDAEPRWDEGRLLASIRTYLDQGLGAKETSRQVAAESGWSRRKVYDLAVEMGRFPPNAEKG